MKECTVGVVLGDVLRILRPGLDCMCSVPSCDVALVKDHGNGVPVHGSTAWLPNCTLDNCFFDRCAYRMVSCDGLGLPV